MKSRVCDKQPRGHHNLGNNIGRRRWWLFALKFVLTNVSAQIGPQKGSVDGPCEGQVSGQNLKNHMCFSYILWTCLAIFVCVQALKNDSPYYIQIRVSFGRGLTHVVFSIRFKKFHFPTMRFCCVKLELLERRISRNVKTRNSEHS